MMTCQVRPSVILSSGDGLFTTRALRKGQLVALYAGVMFGEAVEDKHKYDKLCRDIKESRSPCDRYSISTHMGATIILPPPMDDWSQNMVTSAWKTNNGFAPDTHTYFHDVEHPRFGLVPAISALKDVDAGVELLIDYQYNVESENTTDTGNHAWWFQARREHFAKLAAKEEEEKGSQEEGDESKPGPGRGATATAGGATPTKLEL